MTLLEVQTALMDALVADVEAAWDPQRIFTDQPVLPPTGPGGARPLPEAYINLSVATLDRPEQQRLTAVCLDQVPEAAVRLDVEIALRELKATSSALRLQLHQRAQDLRTRVLWDDDARRLYAGVPAYWAGETYLQDELEVDPQADDCLLRVQCYFVVTVTLL